MPNVVGPDFGPSPKNFVAPETGPTGDPNAAITVGTVENLPDMPTGLTSYAADYTNLETTTNFVWDYGLISLPVASPVDDSGVFPPSEIVRLNAPRALKVVSWVAQAIGQLPKLPSADTQNPNEVLRNK